MRWEVFAQTIHANHAKQLSISCEAALDFVTFGANPSACRRLSHIGMVSRPSSGVGDELLCTIERTAGKGSNQSSRLTDSAHSRGAFAVAKSVCFVQLGTAGEDEIVHLDLRTKTEDAGLREILERILTGVIIFEPLARLLLSKTDLRSTATHIVVATERRERPFIVPKA